MSVPTPACGRLADPKRIAWIDAFRGLALLVVLIDHVERTNHVVFLKNWTLSAIGFCDGAEVFVFISGYVFGLTQSRRLLEMGVLNALSKSIRRSLSIYLAYLITVLAILLLGDFFSSMVPKLNSYSYLNERTGKELFISSVSLSFHPMNLSILAFYVVVLPFSTLVMAMARCSWGLVWGITLGLYGIGLFWPEANFATSTPVGKWFFNPFAWQLLFVIGIACSLHRNGSWLSKRWSLLITGIAMLVLTVAFSYHKIDSVARLLPVTWTTVCEDASWVGGKSGLGPVRLIHFLCLAWLVCQMRVPQHRGILVVRDVLSLWGRHSLVLYTFGCILSFLSLVFFHLVGCSTSTLVLFHVNCLVLCTWVGHCLHRNAHSRSGQES